jgi:hypothetical protein
MEKETLKKQKNSKSKRKQVESDLGDEVIIKRA